MTGEFKEIIITLCFMTHYMCRNGLDSSGLQLFKKDLGVSVQLPKTRVIIVGGMHYMGKVVNT